MNRDKNLTDTKNFSSSRRRFLELNLGAALAAGTGLSPVFSASAAEVKLADNGRILVVLELSGGNDGLNTVVPYTQDEYYLARPTIGIQADAVLKLSDDYGLHPNLLGWERLYKDGKMAIVHGCGYPNPNRSHFEAMKFWHTGVPNAPESRGWVGRLADTVIPREASGIVMNIAKEQSQAVSSTYHPPVVFSNPAAYRLDNAESQASAFDSIMSNRSRSARSNLDFVRRVTSTAADSSEFVRRTCANYRTNSDYGYGTVGTSLRNIAALIEARADTRFYYTNFSGFDTHVSQAPNQAGLFNQVGDAVLAFQADLKTMGREDDVVMLVFTEFGRRVQENASLGTDHGVAGPMYIFGNQVKGGFHGEHPSLSVLDQGDLIMTTDFRSVYGSMIQDWMGVQDVGSVLGGDFARLSLIG
tara:strand:+ start:406 stop:1650 length:1245 start_codon:yes stop_codon:yes gene_type:complete